MPIQVLPDEVASQIAAGEVVERPASVVKELLENALDAGARSILIRVEGAGRGLVEVSDDGMGISADELELAVSRHATSKLASAEDLFRIGSLGFRGEALASIASVARLTVRSRASNSQSGAQIKVDAGRITAAAPVGAPQGTTVRVMDLFYNVPARLKFLKSDRTERRRINEIVMRYSLAYPQVRVQLEHDGRSTFSTSGNGDRREVLVAVYGVEIARKLLVVESREDPLSLDGFISPTEVTRSNRNEITFFVNGRWVHDPALTAALMQAYHTMLMTGRFPLAVLMLDMPPGLVDVNVHPAKAEVRFRQKDRVFSAVQRSVRRALLAHSPVPIGDLSELWIPDGRPDEAGPRLAVPPEPVSFEGWSYRLPPDQGQAQPPSPEEPPVQRVPLLRAVGQVGAAYLVAEGPDGLYLIDQHAAHERVLFEKMMAARQHGLVSQRLLQPEAVELTPAQAALIEEELPVLAQLGFEVEPFGPAIFSVRAVPELLADIDPARALRVLVEDFEEDERPLQGELEARVIARICKRAAVRSGITLSMEEQRALVRDLEACQAPRTCPHGRPTMIHLSVDVLARQFGRK